MNEAGSKPSETHSLIADGNRLSLIEKDSFDPICRKKSLEYPIYFTYHHLFNILTRDNSMSYYNRKYLLEQIDISLTPLMDFIMDYEEDEEDCVLIQITNDIQDKYDLVREKTLYKRCSSFVYLFDDLVEACRYASTCLYFEPYEFDLDDKDSDDFDDFDDTNDKDDKDDNEFSDINCDEFVFEGISYLEDNRFEKIYNNDHKYVGKWSDNRSDIIWLSDEYMMDHESSKVKLE